MELSRVVLFSALFLTGFLIWNAWETDYGQKNVPPPVTVTEKNPAASTAQAIPALATTQPLSPPTVNPVPVSQQVVNVHTDVLDVAIDTLGGNIVNADLLKYPEKLNNPEPFVLLSSDPTKLYLAQSGLAGKDGPDTIQGQAVYKPLQKSFTLEPDKQQLNVDLVWKNKAGVSVIKHFIFHRDSYAVDVNYEITNKSPTAWTGQFYAQLERKKVQPPEHGFFSINPYMGGAISSPEKPYQKISFDKMAEQNLQTSITGGWLAMLEHYFISAWVPSPSQQYTYYSSRKSDDVYALGMLGTPVTVQPGGTAQVGAKLYVGPEVMDRLKAVAPSLDLTVDYGMLWFISVALFWLMKQIYTLVGNWGWSIVIVTILIKLAFYHLSAKSYRSMAAMRNLQPRLQALKERYGDDRQKLTQATMELYKTEKINPLGGCLPILVQIPVFIALYWVLLESVELRQAPFILWIHDLSAKDPYFILPIIMGITMFIQQKLNPPPPDPVQAKMMNFLPVFFTFIFVTFPAGLVLYWVVNNSLSILQQWYIMRTTKVAKSSPIVKKKKK